MNVSTHHFRNRHPRRRGAILIVALVITAVLFALVLALGTSMRVEIQAAGNQSAAAQASAVERGAEQYVLGMLTTGYGITDPFTEDQFQQIQIGDGYFWIVRPDYQDESLPLFGLVEENGKININNGNTATRQMLLNLLDDEDTVTAIQSWRSQTSSSDDEYYLTRPDSKPYQAKHSNFETVEELLMVHGITHDLLYGNGTAPPLGQRSNISNSVQDSGMIGGSIIQNGIYDLVTVSSKEPSTAPDGTPLLRVNNRGEIQQLLQKLPDASRATELRIRFLRNQPNSLLEMARDGQMTADEVDAIADYARPANGQIRININAAPPAVLHALEGVNGIESGLVETLLSARQGTQTQVGAMGWVVDAIGAQAAARFGPYVGGRSYFFSADIVAFNRTGRAFKRCRIIVDASQVPAGSPPQIIYRRDLTDRGCPLPQVMASLRSGENPGGMMGSGFSARGGI